MSRYVSIWQPNSYSLAHAHTHTTLLQIRYGYYHTRLSFSQTAFLIGLSVFFDGETEKKNLLLLSGLGTQIVIKLTVRIADGESSSRAVNNYVSIPIGACCTDPFGLGRNCAAPPFSCNMYKAYLSFCMTV